MIHYYQNVYTGKLRIRMSLLIQLYGSVFRKMYSLVGKTFRMGVMDSVSHFNDGNIATLNTYDEIGLEYGHYTTIGCQKGNIERANNSVRKECEKGYRS